LLNFKVSFAFSWLNEKIINLFHIDLDHLESDLEGQGSVLVFCNSLEHLFCSHGDDTLVGSVTEEGI
jgi:hypothetical protein